MELVEDIADIADRQKYSPMLSILVIDDSALIRNRLCNTLKHLGYETVQAMNGRDGLDKVDSQPFQCAFTDLLMPVMDGFQFLEEMKKHHPDVPVVVVSADIQAMTRERCLELGAVTVLPKPPKEEEIEKTLSDIFASRG